MKPPKPPLWRRVDPFHASALALALGVGWIVGANTLDDHADTARLRATVGALQNKVEAMETASAHLPRSAELKSLREEEARLTAAVHAQNVRLETANHAAQTRSTQTTAQIDRLEKDTRIDQITARMARLEHQVSSNLATASIAAAVPRPSPPVPPVNTTKAVTPAKPVSQLKPISQAREEIPTPPSSASSAAAREEHEAERRPERPEIPATGYVLKDVYQGVALVEGRSGLLEVAPGDLLPGAGRVERIVRRDGGWVVVTSDGIINQENY